MQLFDQSAAHQIGIVPEVAQHDDRHRKDEMDGPVGKIAVAADAVGPGAWQPAQFHREEQDQHERQPEFRHAAHDRAHAAEDAVEQRVFVPRTEHAKPKRQQEQQHEAHAAEAERIGQARADDLQHVHLVFVGDAEIAVQRVLQPDAVLRQNGPVEAELRLGPGTLIDAHFLHAVAKVGAQRVAGRVVRNHKDQQREQKQAEGKRQHGAEQTAPEWFLIHSAAPPSSTKWPGAASTSRPSGWKSASSNGTSFRARSRIGSGRGMAESSARV